CALEEQLELETADGYNPDNPQIPSTPSFSGRDSEPARVSKIFSAAGHYYCLASERAEEKKEIVTLASKLAPPAVPMASQGFAERSADDKGPNLEAAMEAELKSGRDLMRTLTEGKQSFLRGGPTQQQQQQQQHIPSDPNQYAPVTGATDRIDNYYPMQQNLSNAGSLQNTIHGGQSMRQSTTDPYFTANAYVGQSSYTPTQYY
ncbi:MAG: hypothetical protein GY738_16135, partial [Pseudoalteromonas sp.]|nr:hypothetical protein [Pseudoalteromonas sp.]